MIIESSLMNNSNVINVNKTFEVIMLNAERGVVVVNYNQLE